MKPLRRFPAMTRRAQTTAGALCALAILLAAAERGGRLLAEDRAASSTDAPETIEQGRTAYAMYCQACHGAEDAGIDSPSNLFDGNWHHGATPEAVERTIREGINDKGMPGWGQMISSEEISSVIAYLFSFQTTLKPEND